MDKDVSENIINTLFHNESSGHASCFKTILFVNDLLLKKKCIDKTNILFMINENQFIHKKCNQLLIDDIQLFQNQQKQKVWNELMNYIKVIEHSSCLSNSMVMELTVNEIYSFFLKLWENVHLF